MESKLKIIQGTSKSGFEEQVAEFINNHEHYDIKFCVDHIDYYAFIIYEGEEA